MHSLDECTISECRWSNHGLIEEPASSQDLGDSWESWEKAGEEQKVRRGEGKHCQDMTYEIQLAKLDLIMPIDCIILIGCVYIIINNYILTQPLKKMRCQFEIRNKRCLSPKVFDPSLHSQSTGSFWYSRKQISKQKQRAKHKDAKEAKKKKKTGHET